MPAKASSSTGRKKFSDAFSVLAPLEKASLARFSSAFIVLQAFPAFLLAVFVVYAGAKLGYFSLNAGLFGLLCLLVAFYMLIPRMADRVMEGIMALRLAKARNRAEKGV